MHAHFTYTYPVRIMIPHQHLVLYPIVPWSESHTCLPEHTNSAIIHNAHLKFAIKPFVAALYIGVCISFPSRKYTFSGSISHHTIEMSKNYQLRRAKQKIHRCSPLKSRYVTELDGHLDSKLAEAPFVTFHRR